MTPDTFYKTFITALLEDIVIYYIAYYIPGITEHCNDFGTKEGDNKILITAMSDHLYKITICRKDETKEERLRIAKYDFE